MRFRLRRGALIAEAKATRHNKPLISRLAEVGFSSIVQWVLDRFKLSTSGYDAKVYRQEMQSNSDFCKFNDMLRMVLDCTGPQVEQILDILTHKRDKGLIEFGFSQTDQH